MAIIGNLTCCQLELDTDLAGSPLTTASIRWSLHLEGLTSTNVAHASAVNYIPTLDLAGRIPYTSGATRASILADIKLAAVAELAAKQIVGVDMKDVYVPDFSIGL